MKHLPLFAYGANPTNIFIDNFRNHLIKISSFCIIAYKHAQPILIWNLSIPVLCSIILNQDNITEMNILYHIVCISRVMENDFSFYCTVSKYKRKLPNYPLLPLPKVQTFGRGKSYFFACFSPFTERRYLTKSSTSCSVRLSNKPTGISEVGMTSRD